MIEQASPPQTATRNALFAIGVGRFIAGALDLLQACIQLGWDIPLLIAGGLLCGLYFGATVRLVMHLIILPLSALHTTDPLPIHDLLWGLLQKMIVVGLPIAYSVRRFAAPTGGIQ